MTGAAQIEIEPHIIESCPAQLVLGWATLKGTGLIDVLFGTDQFEPESESLYGELQFASLVKEHLTVFGSIPIEKNGEGGSLLPPIDIELKKDAQGRDNAPKAVGMQPCSPWIADLIKQDTDKRLECSFYRPGSGPLPVRLSLRGSLHKDPRRGASVWTH
jgi:hypothetical protein